MCTVHDVAITSEGRGVYIRNVRHQVRTSGLVSHVQAATSKEREQKSPLQTNGGQRVWYIAYLVFVSLTAKGECSLDRYNVSKQEDLVPHFSTKAAEDHRGSRKHQRRSARRRKATNRTPYENEIVQEEEDIAPSEICVNDTAMWYCRYHVTRISMSVSSSQHRRYLSPEACTDIGRCLLFSRLDASGTRRTKRVLTAYCIYLVWSNLYRRATRHHSFTREGVARIRPWACSP